VDAVGSRRTRLRHHWPSCVRRALTLCVRLVARGRELGECGDARCSCYRLSRPAARTRFRNMVVSRTAQLVQRSVPLWEQLPLPTMAESQDTARVRYVSVGCGGLLTDFEILCGFVERGLSIESIVLCDTAYATGGYDSSGHMAAFRLLCGFFARSQYA
jgi:hypothetical protein